MSLSKEDILKPRKPKVVPVEVPELEGTVYVRAMTALQRERFEESHRANGTADFIARMILFSACDEDGKLLFTEADKPAIRELDGIAAERIVEAAVKVNKLTPDQVEDAAKN